MKNLDRSRVVRMFTDYTYNYNSEDPKIKLKIDHTLRVADIAEDIAKSISGDADDEIDGSLAGNTKEPNGQCGQMSSDAVNAVDTDLAWLCGMLHDIGRFEQIRIYNTFVDSLSVDHAQFGANLLFRENLLADYGEFTDFEKQVLELSIRNHSAYRISEDVPENILPYCRILRDADKVDIFRVNCDTPMEDIYNVTTKELAESGVTEEVKQCFLEKHAVLRSLKKTAIDNLVGHLCLVYELEYPHSREIARQQGFVDKLLEFSSENQETREWFGYMREHIWN